MHDPFTPEPQYEDSLKDLPFEFPASSELLKDNLKNRPRWLLDQRNSWHGMDFALHTGQSVEGFYKRYCEALRSVDDSIGAVVEQLKKMGIYEETLVIYMGDNGFMFGEHGLFDKRVAYETSSRVPMLMQCPAIIEGGSVVDQVVANIDIAPTVMQAMGLKKPPHMDGQSFLPLAQLPPAQRHSRFPWREYFLYAYYWEQNYPQTPTHFLAYVESSTSTQRTTGSGIRMSCSTLRPIRRNRTTSSIIQTSHRPGNRCRVGSTR